MQILIPESNEEMCMLIWRLSYFWFSVKSKWIETFLAHESFHNKYKHSVKNMKLALEQWKN